MADWNEEDVRRILANPFGCLTADPLLAAPHAPILSEAEWIEAAVASSSVRPRSGIKALVSDIVA